MLAKPKDSTTTLLSTISIKTSLLLLTPRFIPCWIIQESVSSLVQMVIRFSFRTLLLFEMNASLYVIHIILLSLSWSLMNFWMKYLLRFVLFITLVRKSALKFAGNAVESLNGKISPSKPLLSWTPSFRLSEKYLSVTISNLL